MLGDSQNVLSFKKVKHFANTANVNFFSSVKFTSMLPIESKYLAVLENHHFICLSNNPPVLIQWSNPSLREF